MWVGRNCSWSIWLGRRSRVAAWGAGGGARRPRGAARGAAPPAGSRSSSPRCNCCSYRYRFSSLSVSLPKVSPSSCRRPRHSATPPADQLPHFRGRTHGSRRTVIPQNPQNPLNPSLLSNATKYSLPHTHCKLSPQDRVTVFRLVLTYIFRKPP